MNIKDILASLNPRTLKEVDRINPIPPYIHANTICYDETKYGGQK